MGINGLLKALSPILIPVNELNNESNNASRKSRSSSSPKYNIRQFSNKSIAIDASSWLYKGSYSCAERLVESIEEKRIDEVCEQRLCNYITKRCDELLTHASIKRIYLVFDGKRCPLKEATNKEREMKRKENLKEARRLMQIGNRSLASDKYRACVKIAPWMSDSIAKAIKQKWGNATTEKFGYTTPKVSCVFSPYEADAQLVKLYIDGFVDAIVTEDSDVLAYSAACGISVPIIYKLSRDDGSCDVITMDWLLSSDDHEDENTVKKNNNYELSLYPCLRRKFLSRSNSNEKKVNSKKKQMGGTGSALVSHLTAMISRERRQKGSGARMFVQSCVLAGCDYAPNRLAGVGVITAFKMIKENAHRDVSSRFHHILNSFPADKILPEDIINFDGDIKNNGSVQIKKEDLPEAIQSYETLLAKSEAVFYYHQVRNIVTGEIVPLHSPLSYEAGNSLTCSETNKSELNNFIPSLSRFDGDLSFIGCNIAVSFDKSLSQMKLKTIKQATPVPINPYSVKNKLVDNSLEKFMSKQTSSYDESANEQCPKPTNVNLQSMTMVSSSKPSITSISTNNTMDVYLDDLNEGKENLYLRQITPSVKNSQTSCSSLPSMKSISSDNSSHKSKYFTFDRDNNDNLEERDNTEDRKNCTKGTNMVTPKIETKQISTQEGKIISSLTDNDDDSNDCIVIDFQSTSQRTNTSASSFLGKNSRQSIFEKFQYQKQQGLQSNNGMRGKFLSKPAHLSSSNTKTKRKQSYTSSLSSNKRVKSASIKGFFLPLATKKPN